MPPRIAPVLPPPPLNPPPPWRPVYCRWALLTSALAIAWACTANIAAPLACLMACDGSVAPIDWAACSCRTASASRVRASGPTLPRRVSTKSDTERTCDCALNSAWSNARLSRAAASTSSLITASS
jgi:hypothetical protein